MSDHIFDQRLVRRLCTERIVPGSATVLIDDSAQKVEWAKPGGVHCQAHCKHGHCGSLVKVAKCDPEKGNLVSRIGVRLQGFDALEAGAYVVHPRSLFAVLHARLAESMHCTLSQAMQVRARTRVLLPPRCPPHTAH